MFGYCTTQCDRYNEVRVTCPGSTLSLKSTVCKHD